MDQRGRTTEKQLDYITITNEQRNWATNANVKGILKTNQPHRRRIAHLVIRLRLQQFQNENGETNTSTTTYMDSAAFAKTYAEM